MIPPELQLIAGKELGTSDWIRIDQDMIDAFAEVTGDHQFIHVDPQAAAAQTPFGGTIAHGFLTLSLLPRLTYPLIESLLEHGTLINYGCDKLRFIAPVKNGKKVRARVVFDRVEKKRPGFVIHQTFTIEIEGEASPAIAAQWLSLYIPKQ